MLTRWYERKAATAVYKIAVSTRSWVGWLGSSSYHSGRGDVLREQDPLSLDNEEVDKLMNIANNSVKSLARHKVVLTRADLRGKALVEDKLASDLGGDSDAQGQVRQAKRPADDVEVAGSKDQGNNRTIRKSSGAYQIK